METTLTFNKVKDLIASSIATVEEKKLEKAINFAKEIIESDKYINVDNCEGNGSYQWIDCRDKLTNQPVRLSKYQVRDNVDISYYNEIYNETNRTIDEAFNTKGGLELLVGSCEDYYNNYVSDVTGNLIEYWKLIAESIDVQYEWDNK